MMTRSTSQHSVKHIPRRTCIGCGKVKDKRELIRLVRISDRYVEVDIGGKKPGRGAYLCWTQECWEAGFKTGRLEHTLRATITSDNREQLNKFSRNLLKNV